MQRTRLVGANTHNLKNVSLEFEPGQVVAIAGVSGAGKSSLAFDTLYAEGQRRFVESFSPYARQFLERLERPPIDSLEPVPAGIAVDRRAPVKSSRSTVATMADIEPYLSALFTRESVAHCSEHGRAGIELDAKSAAERALRGPEGQRSYLSYEVPLESAEQYLQVRDRLLQDGYRRLLVDGAVREIDSVRPSEVLQQARATVLLDRLGPSSDVERVAQGIEAGWQRGNGRVSLSAVKTATTSVVPVDVAGVPAARATNASKVKRGEPASAVPEISLRQGLSCPECAKPLGKPVAGLFSYENPVGACAACRGFGRTIGVDLEKVIPDPSKTLAKGAIRPWSGKSTTWERAELKKMCLRHKVPLDKPWQLLSPKQRDLVLTGDGDWSAGLFPGVIGWFRWLESRAYKMHVRVLLARYRAYNACSSCHGTRLNDTALTYRLDQRNIAEWHCLEIREALALLRKLHCLTGQGQIAKQELLARLGYLDRVGLGYLTLDRQARTLSGGEAQRVTLTAALGTSLHNALFVLDEPTVGLHAADIEPLTQLIRELATRDNVVLVVEHDPHVLGAADRIVELGPGPGDAGGNVTFDGTPEQALKAGGATARALSASANRGAERRPAKGWLRIRGAKAHNLRDIDVEIPLGVLCALSGPSGSGKSTLAEGILYRGLARKLGDFSEDAPEAHDNIEGSELLRRVVLVDQSPLGRTSRGNTATYTKAWDPIRKFFATEPASQNAGLSASHFSFNVEGGRCEACSGEGFETVEMQFLADVRLICPVCKGKRFKEAVLEVRHRGYSIADILEMSVSDVSRVFFDVPSVHRALGPVERLGLGYVRLGQPLSTLSGGEAQRLKLARALGDELEGVILILDEPSAGLHTDEVAIVVGALQQLIDSGASVLVVDHDLELIRAADWVIDMGPGGGRNGGQVVAAGLPSAVATENTSTGRALHKFERPSALKTVSRECAPKERPSLRVHEAREHNLRNISVSIPHGALTVVTGPSGSGKSSLAFDVIFAEGQRRFLETLTPYARQFLPTMPRPDVGSVSGVPPAIALEQRTARAGANSTVSTVTEVAHYLRLLFAKLGIPHCPEHNVPIASVRPEAVLAAIRREKGKLSLLAPVIAARKGTYLDVFSGAARDGIRVAICDGARVDTDNPPKLSKSREHTIELELVDNMPASAIDGPLLAKALAWGKGTVKLVTTSGAAKLLSTRSSCPECGLSVPELDPRWFSFNTAQGRCGTCAGEGRLERVKRLKAKRGSKGATELMEFVDCPDCAGSRLGPIPRAVTLNGHHYAEINATSASAALVLAQGLSFSGAQKLVASPIVTELVRRLRFLCDVGLGYLALERSARTLSGGEMQRLRLAAQLGAGLTGALYVLDEPTIGLHPRDTQRLLDNLRKLVNLGSTVLVVEHDAETIRAADHLIDLGPAGGSLGGQLMGAGTPEHVLALPDSPTARALREPKSLREPLPIDEAVEWLGLERASAHNLKTIDVKFPLGRFCVVAGVSGSGKSTLVRQILLPAVRQQLGLVSELPGRHHKLTGYQNLARAISVDQSPIGRTPRSIPATFLGIWDHIRRLFAQTNEAMIRGFGPARFSFNTSAGGRCTVCEGQGAISHEMSFLPDVVRTCPACEGLRFDSRTLEVRYLGLNIGEVLALSLQDVVGVFEHHPKIVEPLKTLVELGAGYIRLGQGSHTLSGGEAQRLKLAAELTAGSRHEPTLYVLDEPTTGLHLSDVSRLVQVLGRLVQRGDTLVVIEHHPQVIAGADYIVELGPESGEAGGYLVAEGPPSLLSRAKTATGLVLKQHAGGVVKTDQRRPRGHAARSEPLL